MNTEFFRSQNFRSLIIALAVAGPLFGVSFLCKSEPEQPQGTKLGFGPPASSQGGVAYQAGSGILIASGVVAIDSSQVLSASNINGTTNALSKFSGTHTVGNSSVTDDGATFSINTNKFQVTESSGATLVAGGLTSTAAANDFGSVTRLGTTPSAGVVYAGDNGLNCLYNSNASGTCEVNAHGYLDSTTQFRNFRIRDGKGNQIALFNGSGPTFEFDGTLYGSGGVGNPVLMSSGLTSSSTSLFAGPTTFSGTTTFNTSPVGINAYNSTHYEQADEWNFGSGTISSGASTSQYGDFNITTSGSGTVSFAMSAPTGLTGHPGVIRWDPGSTAGFGVALTNPAGINFGDGTFKFEWGGGFPQLSATSNDYQSLVGFFDTTGSPNQVDGCYFLYDRSNGATAPGTGAGNTGNKQDWECWCASNSVRTAYVMDGTIVSGASFTTVAAPVGALTYPSTNFNHLKVVVTSTEADFFVGGTLSCKITTNIPSGSSRLTGMGIMHIGVSGSTSGKAMDTDWTLRAWDLTSARTP